MKHRAPFSEIKENTNFYTMRIPASGCEADSLQFYKETKEDSNAWNQEFGLQTIHKDQLCWFYS